MSETRFFKEHQAQTSPHPFQIEVESAEGIYIHTKDGKSYMDMIAGVAVNNIGHRHPKVVKAISEQMNKHMHVMVYGEFIQDAQTQLTKELIEALPNSLNSVYPVNSGTEANEAAIKLVKRVTGRSEIISFRGSYHGSTHGSMSVSGNEAKKEAFRPLLPNVSFLRFNSIEDLSAITEKTAGVIIETIQGDAGVRIPELSFLKALKDRCNEVDALLIFDEIQCGMGRTGSLFAFEHFKIVPDVLTLGKALGGGMSIGALVASYDMLNKFTFDPMLGHITTFGGHPVNCAAAAACLRVLKEEIDWSQVERLGAKLEEAIQAETDIVESRRIGMMFAFDMESPERVAKVVERCISDGLISFWFLSHPNSFRLSPPLTITEDEIDKAIGIILNAIRTTA